MHDAVRELLDELHSLKHDVKSTRSDLAGAFGDDKLDEQRLGELFARHDELLGSARKAFVGALAKIHEILDPRQREQLSRWLGPVGTQLLAGHLKSRASWAGQGLDNLRQNLADYLAEESRTLVGRREADARFAELDRLKLALDRLDARVERLNQRTKPNA